MPNTESIDVNVLKLKLSKVKRLSYNISENDIDEVKDIISENKSIILEKIDDLKSEISSVKDNTIAQLVFNGCEKDIPQFKKYMSSMNMPCSLHEMGISLKSDDLKLLYKNIQKGYRMSSQ